MLQDNRDQHDARSEPPQGKLSAFARRSTNISFAVPIPSDHSLQRGAQAEPAFCGAFAQVDQFGQCRREGICPGPFATGGDDRVWRVDAELVSEDGDPRSQVGLGSGLSLRYQQDTAQFGDNEILGRRRQCCLNDRKRCPGVIERHLANDVKTEEIDIAVSPSWTQTGPNVRRQGCLHCSVDGVTVRVYECRHRR